MEKAEVRRLHEIWREDTLSELDLSPELKRALPLAIRQRASDCRFTFPFL